MLNLKSWFCKTNDILQVCTDINNNDKNKNINIDSNNKGKTNIIHKEKKKSCASFGIFCMHTHQGWVVSICSFLNCQSDSYFASKLELRIKCHGNQTEQDLF